MALRPYFQLGERQKRRHRASLNNHIRLWNEELSKFGLFVSKHKFAKQRSNIGLKATYKKALIKKFNKNSLYV
jgi:hypothetical protein